MSLCEVLDHFLFESTREEEAKREAALQELRRELDALCGLSSVKSMIKELQALVEVGRRRASFRLGNEPVSLHCIFKGNPGTGKTTVARIMGTMLRELKVLSKGQIVEVERADLVAEYIGQTAQKTREVIKKSLGGILFIDEAYSLARGGERDFGKEAMDTLVKAMEDHRDDFVVILAGYGSPMEEFMTMNPGIPSRFPTVISFPDYTSEELFQIAESMLSAREYTLTKGAERKLARLIASMQRSGLENFGNARVVRNLMERTIRRQAVRLLPGLQHTRMQLMEILPEDIEEV